MGKQDKQANRTNDKQQAVGYAHGGSSLGRTGGLMEGVGIGEPGVDVSVGKTVTRGSAANDSMAASSDIENQATKVKDKSQDSGRND
jgi:hypothetical protein